MKMKLFLRVACLMVFFKLILPTPAAQFDPFMVSFPFQPDTILPNHAETNALI